MAVAEIKPESAPVGLSDETQQERRCDPRQPVACDMWMVGHESSTILRCRVDNSGEAGMHLIAPLGYGIAAGQRYELRSNPPGASMTPGFDLSASRWVRVVRTEILLEGGRDRLGLGVLLEPAPA